MMPVTVAAPPAVMLPPLKLRRTCPLALALALPLPLALALALARPVADASVLSTSQG